MYISQLKLWNFRKFGSTAPIDLDKPNLQVSFNKGLNLLVGVNDAGKTTIIDAMKVVLKTYSSERIKLDNDDFFIGARELRIEVTISDKFDEDEKTVERASRCTELLGFDQNQKPQLKLILQAQIGEDEKIKPYDIKAGNDEIGYILTADVKELLKCVYLKPLRDAENELTAKKGSRLSQILGGHRLFKGAITTKSHDLITDLGNFNDALKKYFSDPTKGEEITKIIEKYLESFHGKSQKTPFGVNDEITIKGILELLKIAYEEKKKGLGSQNLLFIATELLHLSSLNDHSLKLALIEEIEAHLHPQHQMRVMDSLQQKAEIEKIQMIFTTHSPNISSKIKLENLILCTQKGVFGMGTEHTKLEQTDYSFLERFLDVTKANLFFANGVIIVEGWGEDLLLPILAKKLGIIEGKGEDWYDLTRNGVSIVNVGSTAYMRYAKIFGRHLKEGQIEEDLGIKVSIISDLDIKPHDMATNGMTIKAHKESSINDIGSPNIKAFISPFWTLEYCIATSDILKPLLIKAMIEAQKEEKLYDFESGILKNQNNYLDELDYTKFVTAPEKIYTQISKGEKMAYTENGEEKSLYAQKISKAILAQNLANILENQDNDFWATLKKEILETGDSHGILYIFNAIKHACGEAIG